MTDSRNQALPDGSFDVVASIIDTDLTKAELTLPDGAKVSFPIDAFAQHCLLNGIDQLGYILGFEDKIKSYEARA